MGPSPLGFLANPQLSTDLVCVYQLPFELGQPCYSPQHDELSKTYVGLGSQHFPLSLAVGGIRSNVNTCPLGFLANPQLSTDLVCLYQLPFESVQPCYSSQHDELSRTYVGLKGRRFPLSLTVRGVGLFGYCICNLDSSLRQSVYDQLDTCSWLHDLLQRMRGALLLPILDLKVLIRGVMLT